MLLGVYVRAVHLLHLHHLRLLGRLVETDTGRLVAGRPARPQHDQPGQDRDGEGDQHGGDDLAQMTGDGGGRGMAVGVAVPMAGGMPVGVGAVPGRGWSGAVNAVPGSAGPTAVTRHGVPRIGTVPVRLTRIVVVRGVRGLVAGHRPIIARTGRAPCSPRHTGRYRGGTFAIAGARSTGLRGR